MAVDKKSQHVGNHGGAYTDMDGMSRQFTYVDHDKKTKIGVGKMSPEELAALKKSIHERTEQKIDEILALPAVRILGNSQGLYEEFIVRKMPEQKIEWNENMVRDACRINDTLRYNMWLTLWRQTVREEHWFTELTYEEIMEGKWKQLM